MLSKRLVIAYLKRKIKWQRKNLTKCDITPESIQDEELILKITMIKQKISELETIVRRLHDLI